MNNIISGIQLGQTRGVYSLEEVHELYTIISELKKMLQPVPTPVIQDKKLSTIKEEDIMEL